MAKDFKAVVNVAGNIDASLDKSLEQAKGKISALNKTIAASAVVAVGAIAGIGKQLYELANEYDGAIDKIQFGTGATGEALAGLQADFEEIYKSVPTNMDAVSTAVADLNTRLGLQGETLQEVARSSIQLSEALGAGDLSTVIEKSAGALNQFKIEQEDVSDAMDHAFKVSQSTGIAYNQLMQDLEKYGPTLQAMNFTYEESATLLGQLKKSGVDAAGAMSAMNKAVQFATAEGRNADEVFEEYYKKIQNASDETKAFEIATEIFGKKGATTMTAAIRSGALAIDDLNEALLANTDTINSTVSATYDGVDEQVQLLKNNMNMSLRDVGDKINKALEANMPRIRALFDRLLPIIEKIGEQAVPIIDNVLIAVEGLADGVEWCIDNWDLLAPAVKTAIALFASYKALQMGVAMYQTAQSVAGVVSSFTKLNIAKMKDKAETLALMGLYAKDAVIKGASTAATVAHTVASTAASVATWSLGAAVAFLTSPITLTIAAFAALVAAGYLVYKNFDKIKEVAANMASYIGDAFSAIVGTIKGPINAISSMINGIIDNINALSITIPDWVPLLGGKSFSLNLPKIPMLANGGFTNGVSIAGEAGTEAVISFNSAVRSQNIDYWEQAGQMLGVLDSGGNFASGNVGASVVYDIGSISFSPQISVSGDVSPEAIAQKLKQLGPEFTDMIIDALTENQQGGYSYG